ncbi:hypothetical protein E8E14_013738 [Neopestalotiopsis sp. 37M]|nr:hypothetical protein E8E14_013738 [Neopestalotiopsis sp. 37M]
MLVLSSTIFGLAAIASLISAHGSHSIAQELAERKTFLENSSLKRADLSHCANKLKSRGLDSTNAARRAARVQEIRSRRGLKKRDVDSVLATSHNATSLGFTPNTDAATLFGQDSACIMMPQVTQGPYYVGGELIRSDITEDQTGTPLYLDLQVIDVNTCEPHPNLWLEIWHCNATGVYSGIVADGNGDTNDTANINKTWLRGITSSNADGVAEFSTIFPGHYTGRATHIHTFIHQNATLFPNGTLGNNHIQTSHVGQGFFDQSLIAAVEANAPYHTNAQALTTNAEDSILAAEAADIDPFFEYTLLGDSIADGLFAWMSYGINSTYVENITPAAFHYAEGGALNPDSNESVWFPAPTPINA